MRTNKGNYRKKVAGGGTTNHCVTFTTGIRELVMRDAVSDAVSFSSKVGEIIAKYYGITDSNLADGK